MKKIACIILVSLMTIACQKDGNLNTEPVLTVESLKSTEMRDFDNSLKEIGKSRGQYVNEEKQLNAEGINILLPASKRILLKSGITEQELEMKEDKEIVKLAFSTYQKTIAEYRTTITSNN